MVNATQICKAGGKKFNDWYRLDSTKELINALEKQLKNLNTQYPVFKNLNADNPTFKIIEVNQGKYGGSWLHPDLAVQLSQWISAEFALQVSRWTRELILTGNVSLNNERNEIELLELQKT